MQLLPKCTVWTVFVLEILGGSCDIFKVRCNHYCNAVSNSGLPALAVGYIVGSCFPPPFIMVLCIIADMFDHLWPILSFNLEF